jgi:DnaJ-domain-containing protein 1
LKAEQEKILEEERRLSRYPVDYDAAARLAFESAGAIGNFDAFKAKYLMEASSMIAKKHAERMEDAARIADELVRLARCPVDYNAAARLAFENAGSIADFDAFKAKYLVDMSAMAAGKHKKRVEQMKLSVAESTEQAETQTKQIDEAESVPFFFLGETKSNGASATAAVAQREEVTASASVKVVDEPPLNGKSESPNPPVEPQVFTAQPKLPKDDPFASGKDVATLISPIKCETLYDILQISTTATRSEIKRSYISLAKESHPDALLQNGIMDDLEAEKRFSEIARAYKILSDPIERRRYDRELKAKGLSRSAGSLFENWVMGAAKAMDEALAKAESDLENGGRAKKGP